MDDAIAEAKSAAWKAASERYRAAMCDTWGCDAQRVCDGLSEDIARRFAVDLYHNWIGETWASSMPAIVAELKGKNLACWCAPGAPCHADVLLDIANGGAKP